MRGEIEKERERKAKKVTIPEQKQCGDQIGTLQHIQTLGEKETAHMLSRTSSYEFLTFFLLRYGRASQSSAGIFAFVLILLGQRVTHL